MTLKLVVLAVLFYNGNGVLSIDTQIVSESSPQTTDNADSNIPDLEVENISNEITTSTYNDVEELPEPIEIVDTKEDQPKRRKYKVTIYRKHHPGRIKAEEENTALLKEKIQSWIAGQEVNNNAEYNSRKLGSGDLKVEQIKGEERAKRPNSYDTSTKILWPAARVYIDIHHKYQAEKQRQIKEIVFVTLDQLRHKSSEQVAEEFIQHYKSFNSPGKAYNEQLEVSVNLLLKFYSHPDRIPLIDISQILKGLDPSHMKNLPYTYTVLIKELLKSVELTAKEKWVVGHFAPFSPQSPSLSDFLYILLDVMSARKGTEHLRYGILEFILTLVLVNTDEPDISEAERYLSMSSPQNLPQRTSYTEKKEIIDSSGLGKYWGDDSLQSSSNLNYLPSSYQQNWLNYNGKRAQNQKYDQIYNLNKWTRDDAVSERGHHNHHHEHQNDHHNSYHDNHMHTEANNTNSITIGDFTVPKQPDQPDWETTTPYNYEWETPTPDNTDYDATMPDNYDYDATTPDNNDYDATRPDNTLVEYNDQDYFDGHDPPPDNTKPEADTENPPWQTTTPDYPTWTTTNSVKRTTTLKYPPSETIDYPSWTTSDHKNPPFNYLKPWEQPVKPIVIHPWGTGVPAYPPWKSPSPIIPRIIPNYHRTVINNTPTLWNRPTLDYLMQRSHTPDDLNESIIEESTNNPNGMPLENSLRNMAISKEVTNYEDNYYLKNLNISELKSLSHSPDNIHSKLSILRENPTTLNDQWIDPTTPKYPMWEIPSTTLNPWIKSTTEYPWNLPTKIPDFWHSSSETDDISNEPNKVPSNLHWDTTPQITFIPWNPSTESNFPLDNPTKTPDLQDIPFNVNEYNTVLNNPAIPLEPQNEIPGPINTWDNSNNPKSNSIPQNGISVSESDSELNKRINEAEISSRDANPNSAFIPWTSSKSNYPWNKPTNTPELQDVSNKVNEYNKELSSPSIDLEPHNKIPLDTWDISNNPKLTTIPQYELPIIPDNFVWSKPNDESEISNFDENSYTTFKPWISSSESNYPWNKPTNTPDVQNITFEVNEHNEELNSPLNPLEPYTEIPGPVKMWDISNNPKFTSIPQNELSIAPDDSVWSKLSDDSEISNWNAKFISRTSTELKKPWKKPTNTPDLQENPFILNEYITLQPQNEIPVPMNTWDVSKNPKLTPIPQIDLLNHQVRPDGSVWSKPNGGSEISNWDTNSYASSIPWIPSAELNYPWNRPTNTPVREKKLNRVLKSGSAKTWNMMHNLESKSVPLMVSSVLPENFVRNEPIEEAEISNWVAAPRLASLPWNPSAESNYPVLQNIPTPENRFTKVTKHSSVNPLVFPREIERSIAPWDILNNPKSNHVSNENIYNLNTHPIAKIPCESKQQVRQMWNMVEKFLGLKNGSPKSYAQIQKLYIILKTFIQISRVRDLENVPAQEIIRQIIYRLMLSLKMMKGEKLNTNINMSGVSKTPTNVKANKRKPSSGLNINPQSYSTSDLADFVLNFVSILSQTNLPENHHDNNIMRSIFKKLADIPEPKCACEKDKVENFIRKINAVVNQY